MAGGYPIYCGRCAEDITIGNAHIYVGPYLDHILYCSGCCPHDHTRPGHLLTALAAEDKAAGRKKRRRRAA